MIPALASVVNEGPEEEAGYWGTGGEEDAVVLNPGSVG